MWFHKKPKPGVGWDMKDDHSSLMSENDSKPSQDKLSKEIRKLKEDNTRLEEKLDTLISILSTSNLLSADQVGHGYFDDLLLETNINTPAFIPSGFGWSGGERVYDSPISQCSIGRAYGPVDVSKGTIDVPNKYGEIVKYRSIKFRDASSEDRIKLGWIEDGYVRISEGKNEIDGGKNKEA